MASPFTPAAASGAMAQPGATTPVPDPTGAVRSERSLGRRASLPGGRALVGAALVVAAAVMTYAAYLGATMAPTQSYVVAARELRVNDRVTAADLAIVDGVLPPEVKQQAFTSTAELEGAVMLAPLGQNTLVSRSAVLTNAQNRGSATPAEAYEVSFTAPDWKLGGGRLQAGELIDLEPTGDARDTGNGRPPASRVRGLRVISLAANGGGGGLGSGSNERVVTVAAADPASYQAVVNVVRGEFWVIRATRAAGTAEAATSPTSQATPNTGTSPSSGLPGLPSVPTSSITPVLPSFPPSTARRP